MKWPAALACLVAVVASWPVQVAPPRMLPRPVRLALRRLLGALVPTNRKWP